MARKIAELLIKIGADTYGVTKMSSDVKKQLTDLQKSFNNFGKSWSKYVTAPLTLAAGFSVKAADVQLKNEQRLLTALRGREDIQQRLIRQAGELQSRSLFGDEGTIAQQAYLASLGRTEEQINNIIEAAAQLSSAAPNISFESAVVNLNKTYSGLAGELGESVSAIKNMTAEQMKNGDAVKYVLDNFKGYAEAARETALGPVQSLTMSLGDLAEEVGKVLMPAVQAVAEVMADFVKWLQDLSPTAKTVTVVLGGLAAAVGPASLGLGGIIKFLPAIKVGLMALLSPAGLVTAAIGGLAYVFLAAKNAHREFAAELADKTTLAELQRQLKAVQDKMLSTPETVSMQSSAGFYMSENPAYTNLRKQEQDLLAAIKIKTDAIELEKKTREELEDQIESQNDAESEQLGLIGQLEKKIQDLEKKKLLSSSSVEDIAKYNSEIKELKRELDSLKNVTLDNMIKSRDPIVIDEVNIKFKKLKLDLDGLKDSLSEQRKIVSDIVRAGLFGWMDDSNPNLLPNMERYSDLVNNYIERFTQKGWDVAEAARHVGSVISNAVNSIESLMKNTFVDLASSIGEGLGNILSGDGTFGDLLGGIVKVMGQFLKSLGQQMIQLGVEMLQIKSALAASFSTPWAAIVAGVAAIAAGQAMINSFNQRNEGGVALAEGGLAYGPTMALVGDNRGAGSDPEVIAPLSKLRQYGLGRQTIEFVGGTFRLSGSDLVLAISREQARINYVNALS